MTEAQIEALAEADAHTSNTGLATYTELLEALQAVRRESDRLSDYAAELVRKALAPIGG